MKEGYAFQYCNTWKDKNVRDIHPKSEFVMHIYDEVKQKTKNPKNSVYRRDKPCDFFHLPEHLSEKEYGERLERVAKEMKKGTGKGYKCTTKQATFINLVFGKTEYRCDYLGCKKLAQIVLNMPKAMAKRLARFRPSLAP